MVPRTGVGGKGEDGFVVENPYEGEAEGKESGVQLGDVTDR